MLGLFSFCILRYDVRPLLHEIFFHVTNVWNYSHVHNLKAVIQTFPFAKCLFCMGRIQKINNFSQHIPGTFLGAELYFFPHLFCLI